MKKRTTQETSIAAKQSITTQLPSVREQILGIITTAGSKGITSDELTNIGYRIQTASARIRELFEQGLIEKSEQRRKTNSGRTAIVWTVKK